MKNKTIHVLLNSAYFFLSHVLIITDTGNQRSRLMVFKHVSGKKNNRKILDKTFHSFRGAAISFGRLFNKRAIPGTKPQWFINPQPDPKWLESLLQAKPANPGKGSPYA